MKPSQMAHPGGPRGRSRRVMSTCNAPVCQAFCSRRIKSQKHKQQARVQATHRRVAALGGHVLHGRELLRGGHLCSGAPLPACPLQPHKVSVRFALRPLLLFTVSFTSDVCEGYSTGGWMPRLRPSIQSRVLSLRRWEPTSTSRSSGARSRATRSGSSCACAPGSTASCPRSAASAAPPALTRRTSSASRPSR